MTPIIGSLAGYTTPTQVYALNKGRQPFTATSKDITIDDVNRYITETAAVLDGILTERSYLTPVPSSATVAHGVLSHYNALGAAYLVEKSAPTSDRREEACRAWEHAQTMLRTGAIQLPDADVDVTHDMPRACLPATPMFTRDQSF